MTCWRREQVKLKNIQQNEFEAMNHLLKLNEILRVKN